MASRRIVRGTMVGWAEMRPPASVLIEGFDAFEASCGPAAGSVPPALLVEGIAQWRCWSLREFLRLPAPDHSWLSKTTTLFDWVLSAAAGLCSSVRATG